VPEEGKVETAKNFLISSSMSSHNMEIIKYIRGFFRKNVDEIMSGDGKFDVEILLIFLDVMQMKEYFCKK